MNDAVYRRNTIIEDRYKVKINEINIRGEASGGQWSGRADDIEGRHVGRHFV